MALEPWAEGHREARERGLGYVPSELVFLALTRVEGTAGEVLRELGITPEVVAAYIDRLQPVEDIDDNIRRWPTDTPAVRHALGLAHGLALSAGLRSRSEHLLLALMYNRHGSESAILGRLGLDRGVVVDRLAQRGVAVPPMPPAPDPEPHKLRLVLPKEQIRVLVEALEKASLADRERFFDPYGDGRWGTNSLRSRPGYGFVSATEGLGLREFAIEALGEAGFSAPPEDAWEILPDWM